MNSSHPRLAVLLARDRPVGAILRRGPSRWACVLRWDVEHDDFELGDWFKGRIYERRCDLSPDGRLLAYFSAAFYARQPNTEITYSRTAVSELPSLQPIISWEKDHCWHGGGLFRSKDHLWVNEPAATPTWREEDTLALTFNEEAHGEDEPVYARRLDRDGWHVLVPWASDASGKPYEVRRRVGPSGWSIVMTRSLDGFRKVTGYELRAPDGAIQPMDAEWADFDQLGRLVGARRGEIVQMQPADTASQTIVLADLNALAPPGIDSNSRQWRPR